MSVIELRNAEFLVKEKFLNYEAWSDKRFIKSGEQIKLRVYYIEDQVITGSLSSLLAMLYTRYKWKILASTFICAYKRNR